jgi:hypothetical protein
MTNSPFQDALLKDLPRQLTAGHLSTELRETIVRWFAARSTPAIQDSELILAALADLAAEQILANPTHTAQVRVMNHFADDIIRGCNAANRRRPGGIEVTIIKQ